MGDRVFFTKSDQKIDGDDEGSLHENDEDSDDDECNTSASCTRKSKATRSTESEKNLKKKRKKGIIYVTNIPKHMNVTRIREYLSPYGDINRVYLQPTTHLNESK